MIRFGMPKGVVKRKSISLIEDLLRVPINKDKLHFFDQGDVHYYLLKHRDIPRLIELGCLDLGITSTEWLYENGSDLYIHKELDWCDTRISLISDKDSPVLSENATIRCITEFPRITRDFFSRTNKNNVTIDNISGSSEALVPSIYNCCVDCVETGKTLLLHNLTEESIIYKSQIVLVSKHTVCNQTKNLITMIMELMSHKEQNCSINGM
ncbi:ATP phosphoribosyltransferase [Paenibacillus durus]|uniref:ATP phosphoribosyltransferase n=1 Tax=Paenibacillus durus TaxID=44251 RepID=A0A089J1M2_PAEDU|nr:ATP phosphoribosyltransferase [Paenibacillus durus]AIQ15084.1 hypothetical protein PDUR_26855 [Paenibacillus durus]